MAINEVDDVVDDLWRERHERTVGTIETLGGLEPAFGCRGLSPKGRRSFDGIIFATARNGRRGRNCGGIWCFKH